MEVLDYGLCQYLERREKYPTKISRIFLYFEIQSQWTMGEFAKEYREAEKFYSQVVFSDKLLKEAVKIEVDFRPKDATKKPVGMV